MKSPIISFERYELERDVLMHNAAQVAGGLEALGVMAGDRVALLLRNSIEFIETTLGIGMIGAFTVPINWHFTASEIGDLLQDCRPRAIFAHEDLTPLIPAEFSDKDRLIIVGKDGSGDYAAWRDSTVSYAGEPRITPGSMVYTSGTTGMPKGVKREVPTPEQQRDIAAMRAALYRIDADSRVLIPGPLYHAMPNQMAIHAARNAAYTLIMARFDPEPFLAAIERERITTVGLAPIMFVRLLRLPEEVRMRYDLTSLRWALHAGGPCAIDVKQAMIDWWGPIIGEYYGGTETGPLTLCTSEEWLERPGTCGKPLEGTDLRLVGEDGADVARGERGEIFGRTWCYPDFTYHNDDDKRRGVSLGPLVTLGDVGYQDEGGYLFLCDRRRDMIVSGGVNIYPAEVESALFGLPGVEDCAVFGLPDPEYGESVAAFIVGRNLEGEAVRNALREKIAAYKVPRTILSIDSLDRDASGKVRKAKLRDRFAQMVTSS